MKVAITGGNGFIGNHLFNYLLSKNLDVVKINRKKDKNGKLTSNFLTKSKKESYLKDIDTIIHCAARVHQFEDIKDQKNKLYIESNVLNTKKLAKEAINNGVNKLIFISSVKVYGEETKNNNSFDQNSKANPLDIYALSKLKAEKHLLSLQRQNKLNVTIIRPPLVYGPGVGANFKKILWAIDKEIPLPFKYHENKRSFIFVENLIAFIYECCINENSNNKIFTISDNQDLSTSELIEKISFYMKKRGTQIKFNKKLIRFFLRIIQKDGIYNKLFNSLQVNPRNSFNCMNFNPPRTLDYGIKKTVLWYLNNQK